MKRDKITVSVFYAGNGKYRGSAEDGSRAVWNCEADTEEEAKELALFRFWKFQREQTQLATSKKK